MKCRSRFALPVVVTVLAWYLAAGPRLADARDAGCSLASSPSGYGCAPWRTHVCVRRGVAKNGNTGHDYHQQLTVHVPFTTAIRDFVCDAFASAPGSAAFDASSPTFLTDVANHPEFLLLAGPSFSTPHVSNIAAICGTSRLAAVVAPDLVTEGKTAIADVALAVAITSKPQGFVVSTKFSVWVARGVLYLDEESELSPPITATVTAVQ